MTLARIALLACTLLLAACASSPRAVDSQVSTDTATAPGAQLLTHARYRFAQTPAVAGQPTPEQVQAMAEQALERVGAVRDDAHAKISVEADARVDAYWARDGWSGPSNTRMALGLGLGSGWHGGGIGLGFGWPFWDDSVPYYNSEVNLVMRDLATGAIIYSTRARHDGPWHDTDTVLAALFVAALEGYPQPAQRVRRVVVPLQQPEDADDAPEEALEEKPPAPAAASPAS